MCFTPSIGTARQCYFCTTRCGHENETWRPRGVAFYTRPRVGALCILCLAWFFVGCRAVREENKLAGAGDASAVRGLCFDNRSGSFALAELWIDRRGSFVSSLWRRRKMAALWAALRGGEYRDRGKCKDE